MTVSERIKAMGFQSSKEAAGYLETTPQTLRDWAVNYPARFEAAILGASIIKSRKIAEKQK